MDALSSAGLLIGVLLVVAQMLYGVQGGRPLRFFEALLVFLAGNAFVAGVRLVFFSVFAFLLDPSRGMAEEGLAIIVSGIALSWISILAIIEIYRQRFQGEGAVAQAPVVSRLEPRPTHIVPARSEPPVPGGSQSLTRTLATLVLIALGVLIIVLIWRFNPASPQPASSATPSATLPPDVPSPSSGTFIAPTLPPVNGPAINREAAIQVGLRYLPTSRLRSVGNPAPVFAAQLTPQDVAYMIGGSEPSLPQYAGLVWLVIFEGYWQVVDSPAPSGLIETAAPHLGCVYTIFGPGTGALVGQTPCLPIPYLR